ncbi:Septum formation initiator [Candidatus Magnetomorum sp. HK-1]|nr:Septum formation initiator [Candidatus Magnetomorum sp. HK-1]
MFQFKHIKFWFVFLLLSFFLFFIIWGDQGFIDLLKLKNEYQQLFQYSATIEQENVNLHRLIKRLKHDPEYVERIARTELGMIRKDETILQFSRRKP